MVTLFLVEHPAQIRCTNYDVASFGMSMEPVSMLRRCELVLIRAMSFDWVYFRCRGRYFYLTET